MALDAATLALTAAELKTTLADAKIAKLFEPTRDELVITLRTRTETDSLLLSARSGSARVCLTEESFENPETPPSFCMLMRKHLTGGRLLDVRMEPGDRIVYFEFQCTNEMGDLVRNILCAELMGRYSISPPDRDGPGYPASVPAMLSEISCVPRRSAARHRCPASENPPASSPGCSPGSAQSGLPYRGEAPPSNPVPGIAARGDPCGEIPHSCPAPRFPERWRSHAPAGYKRRRAWR